MSWIKYLFNPKRSFREAEERSKYADEMTAYAESVEAQLEEARQKLDILQVENAKLREEKSNIEAMSTQLLSQLAETRQERDKYISQLEEANKQVAEVVEIAKMVERFSELKDTYEHRISRLKNKLNDARQIINELSQEKAKTTTDNITTINLNSPKDNNRQLDSLSHRTDTSSVQTRPSQQSLFVDEELTVKHKERTVFDDNDDWFLPLPGDLD